MHKQLWVEKHRKEELNHQMNRLILGRVFRNWNPTLKSHCNRTSHHIVKISQDNRFPTCLKTLSEYVNGLFERDDSFLSPLSLKRRLLSPSPSPSLSVRSLPPSTLLLLISLFFCYSQNERRNVSVDGGGALRGFGRCL